MQASRIQVLDRLTANQIAAGEVVERPASVIKELVENAIDAAASSIEVKIFDQACEKMQVADNGVGMVPEDMRKAVLRHATSKISRLEDLDNLFTLGFRGEALPSIAAVSQLTITSKVKEAPAGYRLRIEEGKAGVPEETGARDGTIILVERLFFNAPARKKFLKTPRWELGLITDAVQNLALSHPGIAFSLYQGNKLLFSTDGNGDLAHTVLAVYGKDVFAQLVALDYAGQGVVIGGMVSLPDLNRSNRNYYTFFVNDRWIKSRELSAMVDEAYRTLLPQRRYPVAVLNLRLPMTAVDVNVHPAKLEVKFQEPARIKDAVLAAIRAALLHQEALVPRLGGSAPATGQARLPVDPKTGFIKLEEGRGMRLREHGAALDGNLAALLAAQAGKPGRLPQQPMHPPLKATEQRLDFAAGATQANEAAAAVTDGREGQAAAADTAMPQAPVAKPFRYADLRPLGQADGTYIIAVGEDGVYFLDQHAAHERVLYERISARAKASAQESTLLAVPLTIRLTLQEHIWLSEGILNISELGFVLEHFGDDTYIIRGVPLWYEENQPEELLRSLLDRLAEEKGDASRLRKDELFMAACKQAIKANRFLTASDISALLTALDGCENPATCPHGRPTAIKLSFSEIRKRFLRSGI